MRIMYTMAMQTARQIFVFILFCSSWTASFAGTRHGNSGDVIVCSEPLRKGDIPAGIYTLDYLMTRHVEHYKILDKETSGSEFTFKTLRDIWSIEDISLETLEPNAFIPKVRIPELIDLIEKKLQDEGGVFDTQDIELRSTGPILESYNADVAEILRDPKKAAMIPSNCRDAYGRIKYMTAIARFEKRKKRFSEISKQESWDFSPIELEINKEIVGKMAEQSIHQLSMLIVHEYLWNYFQGDTQTLWQFNAFLHRYRDPYHGIRHFSFGTDEHEGVRRKQMLFTDPQFNDARNCSTLARGLFSAYEPRGSAKARYSANVGWSLRHIQRTKICALDQCTPWRFKETKVHPRSTWMVFDYSEDYSPLYRDRVRFYYNGKDMTCNRSQPGDANGGMTCLPTSQIAFLKGDDQDIFEDSKIISSIDHLCLWVQTPITKVDDKRYPGMDVFDQEVYLFVNPKPDRRFTLKIFDAEKTPEPVIPTPLPPAP